MKLPIALIEELKHGYTESGSETVTPAEFRAKRGVSDVDIWQSCGRAEEAERLLAKLETPPGSLSDLKASCELFPDGAQQFAAPPGSRPLRIGGLFLPRRAADIARPRVVPIRSIALKPLAPKGITSIS